MKVLLLCALVLAGAFLAEAAGGKELCGMSHDGIKDVLKCMAEHAPSQGEMVDLVFSTKDTGEEQQGIYPTSPRHSIQLPYLHLPETSFRSSLVCLSRHFLRIQKFVSSKMKVLLLCGVILAGALLADAAGGTLNNEDFKTFLKCMGDRVNPQFKETVKEVIGDNTDKVYGIFKKQCDAGVDFEQVAASIRNAYAECKPALS
ncbi:hypothetical protein HPB50_008931 [Hyalomma asiaticum]|uniref:Uncharacterized protein n=1 Tax=Hyalomma asiaticum TaxID=266040 RepID=A0ACB7TFG2_HYAAI|nr:hypothetical protein HPB50_008931 [Hyalomma asiaticum]